MSKLLQLVDCLVARLEQLLVLQNYLQNEYEFSCLRSHKQIWRLQTSHQFAEFSIVSNIGLLNVENEHQQRLLWLNLYKNFNFCKIVNFCQVGFVAPIYHTTVTDVLIHSRVVT